MRAGQFGADAGAAEAVDGLTVEPLGGLALAEQGPQAGLDPQRPLGGGHPGAFGQPCQRGPDQCFVTGPGCRLGQLGHDKGPVPQLVALECPPGGVARGVVPPEAVVQHRAGVVREVDQHAHTACGCCRHGGLDHVGCLWLLAPPGGEHHRGDRDRGVPGGVCDQLVLVEQLGRRGHLAGQKMGFGQEVERELQVHEGTGVAGGLGPAGEEGMPGLEVPQL